MPANTIFIKELNKKLLREQLIKKKEATIFELSQLTGLSVVTVKALLIELMAEGEVYEGESIPSRGGRPSQLYIYNGENRYAVIVFGHEKNGKNLIHIQVINLFGECVYRKESYIEDIKIESFCNLIDEAIKAYPLIKTISFGLPGVEENEIIISNDYKDIVGERFIRFYQENYKVPVTFLNDVNAAVKGACSDKANKSVTCLIGIYFPQIFSPGAGMVINNEVYLGARHCAGEIGHILPDTDWTKLNYADKETVIEAVSKIIVIYCRVVAPELIILYGDFFERHWEDEIKARSEETLKDKFIVNVKVTNRFEKDFERGMIITALEQLNNSFATKDGFEL